MRWLSAHAAQGQMCYLTTPEYMRTFRGRFVYAFQQRGALSLSAGVIVFACDAGGFELPMDRVRQVGLGRFPLHVQLGLRYIDLSYDRDDGRGAVWLVPTHFRRLPVWHTNWVVSDWHRRLSKALAERRGRAESDTPPTRFG